jgi:hypothetical protein
VVTAFNMGKTPTYVSRPAVWIPGGSLPVDGCLTISCVKKNGDCDGPFTYGVVRDGDTVTVWRIGGDDSGPPAVAAERTKQEAKRRPYRVTVGASVTCDCRSRHGCKHKDAIVELVKRKLV